MKKLIFLLFATLAWGQVSAQQTKINTKTQQAVGTITVSGSVVDTTGAALPGAIVKLMSAQDTLTKNTDVNGKFTFSAVSQPSFSIFVSTLGYRSQLKKFSFKADRKTITLDPLVMRSESLVLHEVVINQPNTPYKLDVVEYRSSEYKVRNNQPIDDLLKKMAGVAVAPNGAITHNGQAITNIRVNGKRFIGGDPAQALKNLPAEVIERIQVIDDYGQQANLTGVKVGDPAKVLNISVQTPEGNTESYAKLIENRYQNPYDAPLSTFSVDVDNASYSNIRRFINNGQLPLKDAVRIEEMINYFKYQLPEPKGSRPVAIATELSAAPWAPEHRLLRVGLKARTVPTDKLPASNLVFLIDVSGSMNAENKLPLVKESMKMLVQQLRSKDKVSIVVYAGAAGQVLPATHADQKQVIFDAIDRLEGGGSTAGGAGIKLAYKIARQNLIKGGNNRVILATDGDFNVGESSDESMEALITKERESGVDLSVLGFGMGNYKDSKMETLADKGNGNYAYIDNMTEAHKALVSEFGGTIFTVAKDVKLQIEFNPAKVQAYRLIGYENRMLAKEDFNNDKKDAGDMGSGHTVTALYEIVPVGAKDPMSVDPLKYQKPARMQNTNSNEMLTIKFRYKEPQGNASKLSETIVYDKTVSPDQLSADHRFAAAVAEIGMLLRGSEFKGDATFEHAISLAKSAKGNDEDGYRAEFIRLAETAAAMSRTELAGK
ncbi:YfbK domain-containing protein [Mucilaginibacter myungsuensis]|uniref:von Willebrand factor type A domain-containing protein n=1 Tax=Mucilaginibacter myungsuensis TaxID=649104 RepID=A0A929PVP8_9SPHI|nr:von Willebrand factor type A domain-containing protein [Mucilaginibacter myungsuensis]MBE9661251.1 von Willebrand factor type A domain-containing protein [Mucilaginibacter myungsuensis]MDN3597394.1 von Willebrand factor type A domain-containing protein [Mucilaginibacter myungsuensis]